MPAQDGRQLSHETLEAIRIRAVRRVREDGASPEEVISALGFHRSCMYDWLKRYDEGGIEALRAKPIPGAPSKLSGEHSLWLRQTIVEKTPLDFGYEVALWTRSLLVAVLAEVWQVRISEPTMGRWLRYWGLSVQKPLRRAYERDEQRVEQWMREQFPALKRQAKAEGAAVYFGDEASLRSDSHSGTTWAPVGQTPIVRGSGQRFSVNMLSAVNSQGALRFMLTDQYVNATVFIDFLKRLLRGAQQPVWLIVDGHPAHRAKRVQQFVAQQQGRLQLFFLPPYAPDLNPDEWVWAHVKHHRLGKRAIKNRRQLKRWVSGQLRSLQKSPDFIKRIFQAPALRYILAD